MTGFGLWQKQVLAIVSLEWRKTMFAKRGLWVYIIAFLPVLLYGMNAWRVQNQRADLARVLAESPQAPQVSASIQPGMKIDEVTSKLQDAKVAYSKFRRGKKREFVRYADGVKSWELLFNDGQLKDKRDRSEVALNDNILIFASSYQFFFVRLVIFFGCVGIFMNLFRGEMLDQSLHHYLLAPVRREVLMVGKYMAGLLATIAIFGTSTALQFYMMLSAHPSRDVSAYMQGPGTGHLLSYLLVTALACAGYGSVFLAAGIVLKNPMLPATAILFWEGANWFLPEGLKQFSVIYYLQALCPVVAPLGADVPDVMKLLVTTAAPIAWPVAVLGLIALSAAVLAVASIYVRKLEINYSSD